MTYYNMIGQARRRALCERPVTLNGEPAVISGALRRFATVTSLVTGLSAEWSWAAVQRVIAEERGAFQS